MNSFIPSGDGLREHNSGATTNSHVSAPLHSFSTGAQGPSLPLNFTKSYLTLRMRIFDPFGGCRGARLATRERSRADGGLSVDGAASAGWPFPTRDCDPAALPPPLGGAGLAVVTPPIGGSGGSSGAGSSLEARVSVVAGGTTIVGGFLGAGASGPFKRNRTKEPMIMLAPIETRSLPNVAPSRTVQLRFCGSVGTILGNSRTNAVMARSVSSSVRACKLARGFRSCGKSAAAGMLAPSTRTGMIGIFQSTAIVSSVITQSEPAVASAARCVSVSSHLRPMIASTRSAPLSW